MEKSEILFIRKYNELQLLIIDESEYSLLKASAILRHFFIDGSPLVDAANRNHKLKINYKVDSTFGHVFEDNSKLNYTPTRIGNLVLKQSLNLQELNKQEFLKLPIIQKHDSFISVRETIKYLANKEGAIHLDQGANNRNIAVSSLCKSSLLCAIKQISIIALIALEGLKHTLIKKPDGLPLLAHYCCGPSSNKHIYFKGDCQFLETRNMNTSIKDGFGALFEIYLLPQIKRGNRVIYEIGGDSECFNFKMQVTKTGSLECCVKINSIKKIKAVLPNYLSLFSEKWVSIASFVEFNSQTAILTLRVNNKLVEQNFVKYRRRYSKIDDQVIGGNLRGKQNASFRLVEQILLNDKISEESKIDLLSYFEGNWK